MTVRLRDLRPVHVVGVGLHPYQKPGDTPYTELGVRAIRGALADAGLEWSAVETAYTGTATTAMGLSRLMYRHLGASGISMAQVENASASGSTAVRQACIDVAAGLADVAIAVGVDKPLKFAMPHPAAKVRDLVGQPSGAVHPFRVAREPLHPRSRRDARAVRDGGGQEQPQRRRQPERPTSEGAHPRRGHGAAAHQRPAHTTPVLSRRRGRGGRHRRVRRRDLTARARRQPRRAGDSRSVARSETVYRGENFDAALTRETAAAALADAGISASDLDVVELHDAFTVEELLYIEALGLAPEGKAAAQLAEGQFDIGGRVAVSASGGLLSMGHPIGPTGVGQICELTTQLRGEGGERQHPGARTGVAHMVGVGAVCVVHVLQAP